MPDPSRVMLYVRDMAATAAFYETHFDYRATQEPSDRLVELLPANGSAMLVLHQAAKSQKSGQTAVKLVFDVADVEGFCREVRSQRSGLRPYP